MRIFGVYYENGNKHEKTHLKNFGNCLSFFGNAYDTIRAIY